MILLLDQLLLLGATVALGAAGWRLAGPAVPSGLLRAIAAVVLACGGAVLSALALGLVGLGASPVVLSAAAAAIWLAAWRAVPATGHGPGRQLTDWWRGLAVVGRAAVTAVAGALAAYVIWVVRHPLLGPDALTYHLGLPVQWIHNGRPGSLVTVDDNVPFQNYQLTWEVLVAWVTGIGRTLVPAMLMTPASLVLLGASVRVGLREVGVSGRLGWLAVAALVTLPLVVLQLPGPNNDLPETAFLASAAALVAGMAPRRGGALAPGARGPTTGSPPGPGERHPALLAAAVVAIGLCVGTKATGAALAAVVLVLGAWTCRRDVRRLAKPLALATAAAVAIGGIWYLRNLIDHGSPFWPLVTTPWGDPVPAGIKAVDVSLLSDFHVTLHGHTDAYWRMLAGGVILFAGAVLSAAWATRNAARWGAVAAAAALLVWAASPFTANSFNTALAVSATRYLLPCLLASACTLALAARRSTSRARTVIAEALSAGVFLGAVGVNLYRDQTFGFPLVPGASVLLVAAAAAAAALGAEAMVRSWGLAVVLARRGVVLLSAAAAALALLILIVPVNGYLSGHAGTEQGDAGLVRWLQSRPAFRRGDAPVFLGPAVNAVLTGARLAHPLDVLPLDDTCSTLTGQASRGWIVIEVGPTTLAYVRHWLGCLPGRKPAYFAGGLIVYAPPRLAVA